MNMTYEKVIITPNNEFTMMEPLDATHYTYDVSVVIHRMLDEALPSCTWHQLTLTCTNSSKLNLQMEGILFQTKALFNTNSYFVSRISNG